MPQALVVRASLSSSHVRLEGSRVRSTIGRSRDLNFMLVCARATEVTISMTLTFWSRAHHGLPSKLLVAILLFLSSKINNTFVQVRLLTIKFPSRLTELDQDQEYFFPFCKSRF